MRMEGKSINVWDLAMFQQLLNFNNSSNVFSLLDVMGLIFLQFFMGRELN